MISPPETTTTQGSLTPPFASSELIYAWDHVLLGTATGNALLQDEPLGDGIHAQGVALTVSLRDEP